MMRIDARLPLRFGALTGRQAGEAVLLDADLPCAAPVAWFDPAVSSHDLACACCAGQSAAGVALAALFRARAMGTGPAFRGVLAVVGERGEAAVRAALETDAVASGRFRLGG